MRAAFERLRHWTGAPTVFLITALVAGALLLFLESQTPLDIRSSAGEDPGVVLIRQMVHAAGMRTLALGAGLLLALAPLAALRSTLLGVALVVPRVVVGGSLEWAWPWTAYAALLGVALCTAWRRPRTAWLVALAGTALPIAVVLTRGRMMTPGGSVEFGPPLMNTRMPELLAVSVFYLIATVVVMLLGVLLRRDAQRALDVFELLRRRREVAREAVVVGERARLARDLHDVVAHHVSLIAVRAETAPYTYPDLSPDARLVLGEIAADSRKALDELRGVLGVLGRSADQPARAPLPTAADIAALVNAATSAGDEVSATLDGLETVLATPGHVAFRVAQEALTNARRHAPGVPVEVLAQGDGAGGVRVRVSNPSPLTAVPEAGAGLTGMAERVAAVGGELDTEIRGGEFVVEARLPAAAPGTGNRG